MRDRIRGYAAAALETASANDRLDRVVNDLHGFSVAVGSSDALRGALTDTSISNEVRRAIVIDLVEAKAAPETTTLLSFAVRLERAGEFASTVSALVVQAEAAAEFQDPEALAALEPQASHSLVRERIVGYAERILQELSSTNDVDEVEDELFRFARLIDDNAPLRQVLQDVNNSYAARAAIVFDLLENRVRQATMRIVRYVLRAGRSRDLVGVFDQLVELAAAERGRRVAEVRAAVELASDECGRLAAALGRLVEREVEIRVIHDPKVIGGMLVSIGDLVIDGTVRIRFERLRDLLVQAS